MEFKILDGFSRYLVYSDGRIYDGKLGYFLNPRTNSDGYNILTLRNDSGKRKNISIHRIVALCFIDNPENKPTVNHIDGNKTNNYIHNLEWATRSEQTQHAWDNGLINNLEDRRNAIRDKIGKRVLCETTGEIFKSVGEACDKYGLKKSNLSRSCLKLKNYKSCGKLSDGTKLTWRFYDDDDDEQT